MWVKICGNTRLEDCLLAAELGADAIGFVFAEGRRTVSAAAVAPITAELPRRVDTVGVFDTPDLDRILKTVDLAGLTGVQLHCAPDFGVLERLRRHFGEGVERCSVIQTLHWQIDADAGSESARVAREAAALALDGSADAILLDTKVGRRSGGTGVVFDWQAGRKALEAVNYNLILAGGLTPENLSLAAEAFAPWGVDVSSGVETSPGIKDPRKMAAFIATAKQFVKQTA